MSKNTLFNYFSKPPGSASKSSPSTKPTETPKTPASKRKFEENEKENKTTPNSSINGKKNGSSSKTPVNRSAKKQKSESKPKKEIVFKSESEEEAVTPPEKRRRLIEIDSEGDATEDEFKPDDCEESSDNESLSEHSESEPESVSEGEDSPVKGKKRKAPSGKKNGKKAAPSVTPGKQKISLQPSTPATPTSKEKVSSDRDNWPHLKYDFLQPNRIKDIKMRPASHPEYDPKTVHVPEDFKMKLSPGMRQWWELKSKHFDCVIFFKVGKFYELYHMDAVIGANELNLLYMKGEFAHTGFPEVAYGKYAASMVERGHKVARVEQTETPDMMAERVKRGKSTKFDKVVKREICQLTTKGTKVFSVQDGESVNADSNFLVALTEKDVEGKSVYGVCFVDTSIAVFHLGQFTDDKHCSRLRTLFAHHPPAQILYERGQLSPRTLQVLNTSLVTVMKEQLAPESEFWSSTKTLTTLSERKYFEDGTPEGLKQFLGEFDTLGLTAHDDADLAVRALGAVTWYLSRCLLDQQLLSMGQFKVYVPVDCDSSVVLEEKKPEDTITARHMILDSVTLKNLHVLENSCGGTTGTLLYKLDHCSTPMGKRLLRQWLCNPVTSISSICARQTAVTELIGRPELIQDVRPLMTKLPDLERLLARIYAQSSRGLSPSHPDSRAIFFEERTYSKKKIEEFISVLNGFNAVQDIALKFQESGVGEESEMLAQCSHFETSNRPGKFPDLTSHLDFFKNAFDHEEASKEGNIVPSPGVDPDYDQAVEALSVLEKKQKAYLKSQCEYFGCKVSFVGADKKRFQLEIPEPAVRKITSSEYQLQGQRKGFKKYYTPEAKELLEEQIAAEERRTNVLHGLRKRIFSRFSERYEDWISAIQCLSVLDVLMAFAEYSRGQTTDVCIPEFVPADSCVQPFVTLRNGSYPCTTAEEVFIPNDTVIGDKDTLSPSLLLVTGPNMGGKSTLMRQLGLIVIMAQLGCRVPAESLKLSPVDRIFTRLGANDDIMAGESTFYLELCETSAILAHATKHSLVLIDELGRGTSTYDGTAIANAVLRELTDMQCRTLFSTHYHSLVEDFKDYKNVALGHMACMAESEMDEDSEGMQENVTFLYKFAPGACPKSYGFNAARLAGVPKHIIKLGYAHAKALEAECHLRKTFQSVFRKDFNAAEFKQQVTAVL
ncbi:DNA mismatch repair protein Msh6-like [Macrosteles quadrilineatus]|uniref:DNA mismatch repair protein Msh6-like n=1 Tax=Macrosteles quadrilineatus TaxID=74068 RepID=UPI0023E2F93E|nr:DNA mismatch repair protein Msh6-like [Macrosteles quadrilineatus]